jgi:hypothetical protein
VDNPCPYCNEDFPKDFPGLKVEPHVKLVAFKLWLARGRVLTYAQLGSGSYRRAHTYLGKFRAALKDHGLPWAIQIEHNVGARLVKIQRND